MLSGRGWENRVVRWLSPILLLAISAAPAVAAVELGESPRVVARAYADLPEDKEIAVEFDQESDLNQWIRERITIELEGRGYRIVDSARQILSFRSQLRSDHDSGTRFSLQADAGINRGDSLLLDYKVPLGERPGFGSSTYFSVTATLGFRGERAVWQGTSSARTRHRRAVELQPQVVSKLMSAFGKTVGGASY
jgi:hypothetical protein